MVIFFILDTLKPIVGYMNGIPRLCLPSSFNIIAILFLLFKPIYAYIINLTIVRFTAYVGMHILLRTYVYLDFFPRFIAVGCALCFAILPLYPLTGLSILGLPLLLYVLLNLLNNKKLPLSFFIIGVFTFYSSLWYANFFIIVIWATVIIID